MTFSTKDTQKCKGFAILIMLFHHMYADTGRFSDLSLNFAPFPQWAVVDVANFMKICVGIYVFLSAYGLALSYRKWDRGDGKFVAYRYLKMMLPFFGVYVLMVLISLVIGQDWNIFRAYGLEKDPGLGGTLSMIAAMGLDFFGLAHLFGTPTFNATWWYMSLATVIIVLMPLLCRWCEKLGWGYAVALAAVLPFALGLPTVSLTRYLLCMVLGVAAAQNNLPARLKTACSRQKNGKKLLIFAGMTALCILAVILRQGKYKGTLVELWDSVIPVLYILYLYLFVNDLPGISHIFSFFGKYSTTIFLTHTFIRFYWLRPLVYWGENIWLNYLSLVVLSTAAAMVIDTFFDWIRYHRFSEKLLKKLL